jgi:hypothetical protein
MLFYCKAQKSVAQLIMWIFTYVLTYAHKNVDYLARKMKAATTQNIRVKGMSWLAPDSMTMHGW